jgi:hypothetical protein
MQTQPRHARDNEIAWNTHTSWTPHAPGRSGHPHGVAEGQRRRPLQQHQQYATSANAELEWQMV